MKSRPSGSNAWPPAGGVSQAEVVRRSVEQAEKRLTISPSDIERRLETARQLRASLKNRKVDVVAWIATARDSRR
jgi:hypothetical protein